MLLSTASVILISEILTQVLGSPQNYSSGLAVTNRTILKTQKFLRTEAIKNNNQNIRDKRQIVDRWTIHARSLTTTHGDGRIETTVWYFNPRGESFKFTFDDKLPVSQNEMIDWIDSNRSKFKLTHIPYEEQNSEQPAEMPTESYPLPQPHTIDLAQAPAQVEPNYINYDNGNQLIPEAPSCGRIQVKVLDKIAFGAETEIERTPWQAGIIKRDDGKLLCGGSIITKRHIVTAAHCFRRSVDPESYRVTVGTDVVENIDMLSLYEAQQIYVHSFYHSTHKRNDVAVILLKVVLKFSNQVFPICLPPMDTNYQEGKICTAGGWGGTENDRDTQHNLRTVSLKITGRNYCVSKYFGIHNITPGMFCAEGTNSRRGDTCGGDSGGPLACRNDGVYYLYGITSFGDVGVCEGKSHSSPGVYVHVLMYRKWIYQQIKKFRITYERFMNRQPQFSSKRRFPVTRAKLRTYKK